MKETLQSTLLFSNFPAERGLNVYNAIIFRLINKDKTYYLLIHLTCYQLGAFCLLLNFRILIIETKFNSFRLDLRFKTKIFRLRDL